MRTLCYKRNKPDAKGQILCDSMNGPIHREENGGCGGRREWEGEWGFNADTEFQLRKIPDF